MERTTSLHRSQSPLTDPEVQFKILEGGAFELGELPRFSSSLKQHSSFPLKPTETAIFQVNLGYMCNQTCGHCHVDAGPTRREIMDRETMTHCLVALKKHRFSSLDLTGGAPEMNPDFKWFVEQARPLVDEIIVRSNLTIFSANRSYHDLPEFFARHGIRVISSLPFYKADKTDRQRGDGVFAKSITALRALNALGYGQEGHELCLDLVYNPSGAFLPAPQASLEKEFKRELQENFDVVFNKLYCLTNLPVNRFLDYLLRSENYEDYMEKLVAAFNPATLPGLMCRNTLSVAWNGTLFDCDFNQMLNIPIQGTRSLHISTYDPDALKNRDIAVHQHCYGCTAGAGSSCQGSLA